MAPATYLGFDPGRVRLGVAVGASITGSANALTTLPCRNGVPPWPALLELIDAWRPAALIVGRACHADGSASSSTALAAWLAGQLAERCGLAVHLVDERLSSHEATARSGRQRGDPALDASAAAVILETWLTEASI